MLAWIVEDKKEFVAGDRRSGFMVNSFVMRLMHMWLDAFVVSEMVNPSLQEDDILNIASDKVKQKVWYQ